MLAAALVTDPIAIFLIVLVIILCAPLLLNKLKIPHIIGMIVAGVIVGPYGFNVLANDSSFAIFGQVGLLYLMFLAGLEIDMFHLRLNLRRGVAFGFMTLLVPLLLGVVTSAFILKLDWVTSVLLGSMYASHTLISYPVAARFGITKSPAVLISIVGTIVAVFGALIILAAAVNVRKEGAFNFYAILALFGRLAVYTAAVLYIYPRLTRFFFKTYSDKVTQYVYLMAMVFLSAFGAQLIGLEAVLGAFIAGIVLNRFVPSGSSLMSSTEFVGNALFIPYFLISVGMMIDLTVVLDKQTLIVSLLMLTVALVGKYIPAWIAQKVNRLSPASRGVMFGLTTAHTAVALAVVTLGYKLGMLDHSVLNSTIIVILISCAVAPIFTSAWAPKLKIEMMESEDGTGDNMLRRTRHNNTLVAVGSPLMAPSLMELAILMRNDHGSHRFYALHVRNENSNTAKAVSRNALDEARDSAALADVPVDTIERFDINTVTGVLNTIIERDITEVIIGMHRRSMVIDSFFGAKIEQLLHSTNRMVVITRCFIPLNTVKRIVVWAPPQAEYESGFARWVRAMARLTRQVGCRIIFCCTESAQPLIRGVIYQENYGIRTEFHKVEQWDDFILMSNLVVDDDLFVVIGARVNSVSYSPEMVEMPNFLQKYFSRNNLLVIFPEQFGEAQHVTSFVDPLATDIVRTTAPWLLKLRVLLRHLYLGRKHKKHKIDL